MMARKVTDKPTIMCTVTSTGLSPSAAYDGEMLSRYSVGSEVEVTLHQPRNQKQSRLFWVILGKVVDNQDIYPNAEALASALKIELGHFESIQLIGGGLQLIPKSIRDMERDEFSQFMDKAWQVIAHDIIPGLDIDALVKEGRVIVGGDDGV